MCPGPAANGSAEWMAAHMAGKVGAAPVCQCPGSRGEDGNAEAREDLALLGPLSSGAGRPDAVPSPRSLARTSAPTTRLHLRRPMPTPIAAEPRVGVAAAGHSRETSACKGAGLEPAAVRPAARLWRRARRRGESRREGSRGSRTSGTIVHDGSIAFVPHDHAGGGLLAGPKLRLAGQAFRHDPCPVPTPEHLSDST